MSRVLASVAMVLLAELGGAGSAVAAQIAPDLSTLDALARADAIGDRAEIPKPASGVATKTRLQRVESEGQQLAEALLETEQGSRSSAADITDDPINNRDPTGKLVGVDDLAACLLIPACRLALGAGAGAIGGAAFNSIRQVAQIIDDPSKKFSGSEVLMAAAQGAIAGALIAEDPVAGAALALTSGAASAQSAKEEYFDNHHVATAFVDAAGSALSFAGGAKLAQSVSVEPVVPAAPAVTLPPVPTEPVPIPYDGPLSVAPETLVPSQPRGELNPNKAIKFSKTMAKSGPDALGPVDVAVVDGRFVIVDGHHRAVAAAANGLQVPITVGPAPEGITPASWSIEARAREIAALLRRGKQ